MKELNPKPTRDRSNWPEWARGHFPGPGDPTEGWQPLISVHALASRALVVATTRIEGAWCAYADAVPGMNHEAEKYAVLRHGDKVSEELARVLFPGFERIPYEG